MKTAYRIETCHDSKRIGTPLTPAPIYKEIHYIMGKNKIEIMEERVTEKIFGFMKSIKNIRGKNWFASIIVMLFVTDIAIFLNIPFLRQVLGFLCFTILPGLLILHVLELNKMGFIENFVLSVGLSVSFLMFGGLFMNEVYYAIGYKTPLSTYSLTISFTVAMFGLCYWAYKRNPDKNFTIFELNLENNFEKILFLMPLLFPFLSIFGAVFMNITDSNIITVFTLLLITAYVILLISRKSAPRGVYPFALLMISVSLLFMQSLRSNNLVGADIFAECYRAQFIVTTHHWDISFFHDTLNACLSVGILPPVYHFLSGLPVKYVIKIIYPLIYSLTPLCVYLISKKYLNKNYAFLASFLYMSQYFFILCGMVPVRTGLAVFFCALFMFVFFNEKMENLKRRFLHIIFLICIIFSHYSTSYMLFYSMLILLIITLLLKFANTIKNKHDLMVDKTPITITLVLLFFCVIFFWYGQLTEVPFNQGVDFVERTFINLNKFFNEEMERNILAQETLSGAYLFKEFPYKISYLSQMLTFFLIGIGVLYTIIKEFFPKLFNLKRLSRNCFWHQEIRFFSDLKLYLPFFFSRFRIVGQPLKYIKNNLNTTYIIFSSVLFGILFSILSIPFFGYDYQRPFMLALVLVAPLYILGAMLILKPLKRHALIAITAFVVLQFMCASGMVFVILGVHQPFNIILNSQSGGENWGYVHDQEVASFEWLKHNGVDLNIYGDGRIGVTQVRESPEFHIRNNFFKDNKTIEKGYIYLRYLNVVKREVVVVPGTIEIDNLANYSHLFVNKNEIYANGGSEIYI